MVDVLLTSSQTWAVPSNCRKINWIRAYGAGAYGASGASGVGNIGGGAGGPGGGGGAFAQSNPVQTNPGDTLAIVVGSGNGGDTSAAYQGTYQAYAQGGRGQTGGQAASSIGAILFSGGSGASGGAGVPNLVGGAGGGGGGGAGPSGGGASGGGQSPGGGGGADAGQGGTGGTGGQNFSVPGAAGTVGFAYGGGGGGGGGGWGGQLGLSNAGGAGAASGGGLIWINYDPSVLWQDNAGVSGEAIVGAQGGVLMPLAAHLGIATGVVFNTTSPQRYISALLSPSSTLVADAPNRLKSITTRLTASLSAIGRFQGPVSLGGNFSVSTGMVAKDTVAYAAKSLLSPGLVVSPFLSQISHVPSGALLAVTTGVVAKPMLPLALHITWNVVPSLGVDLFPAQSIGAVININSSMLMADAEIAEYQWNDFGAQLLYSAATGLEKAMIDADAPRLTAIYAEAIIDSWDPYAIDIELLPYLAWAMGVNFWNDQWSEQTKRDWVAAQWQFKALRGTNAGIEMAIDFAGRDISPYGYKVRDIITAPQGQYPSPSTTPASQEAWLASLPQVRVYLNQSPGQALPDEIYSNVSFLPPG